MTPLIQITHLVKSYPDGEGKINTVLRSVHMEVAKGEFIAIRGASGSGKTTLLSILGTLLPADAGSYLLDGKELLRPGIDHARIRNEQIGFVFQDHRLLPQYNVAENILLPVLAQQKSVNRKKEQYARHLMEMTGITQIANQYPATLSGGESGRVALCRALIMQPLLVLADEPTGQLDTENARNIANRLADINRSLQTTILMVTHSDEVSATAHRILTLKDGILQ